MKWTSERPSAAGWYWFLDNEHGALHCVELTTTGGVLLHGSQKEFRVADLEGRWAAAEPPLLPLDVQIRRKQGK